VQPSDLGKIETKPIYLERKSESEAEIGVYELKDESRSRFFDTEGFYCRGNFSKKVGGIFLKKKHGNLSRHARVVLIFSQLMTFNLIQT
jgi:hypothetical protein